MNELIQITDADADSNKLLRSSAGILSRIVIGKTSAHALEFYDTTDIVAPTNGRKVTELKASIVENTYCFEGVLLHGLVVVVLTGYAGEATVAHRAG